MMLLILHHMLLEMVRKKQLTASDDLFCWFASSQMKANTDKYHLIAICYNEMSICVNNYNIKSRCEKLLGIKIDHKQLTLIPILMRSVKKFDKS